MVVTFHHSEAMSAALVDRVRLQLTRKPQIGPLKI
jgi:hypothetical protein